MGFGFCLSVGVLVVLQSAGSWCIGALVYERAGVVAMSPCIDASEREVDGEYLETTSDFSKGLVNGMQLVSCFGYRLMWEVGGWSSWPRCKMYGGRIGLVV